MEDRRFIKPSPGMAVRLPDSDATPLPTYGKGVLWSSYWQRRLDQGDIVLITEKAVAEGEKAAIAALAKSAETTGDAK